MHVLIATDANWVLDEVRSALEGPGTTFTVCRDGRDVVPSVKAKTPDIAICDLQIGTMGGMAVTMSRRLDESAGAIDHIPVLMLLDRTADVHLARRSGAETWLVKPLDPLSLRRAVEAAIHAADAQDDDIPAAGESGPWSDVAKDGEPAVSG